MKYIVAAFIAIGAMLGVAQAAPLSPASVQTEQAVATGAVEKVCWGGGCGGWGGGGWGGGGWGGGGWRLAAAAVSGGLAIVLADTTATVAACAGGLPVRLGAGAAAAGVAAAGVAAAGVAAGAVQAGSRSLDLEFSLVQKAIRKRFL